MSGPDIKRNIRLDADIIDLAPTILYLSDIPIPEDMDGKVLKQGLLLSKDPQYDKSSVTSIRSQTVFSDKEQDELMERLRALGYID